MVKNTKLFTLEPMVSAAEVQTSYRTMKEFGLRCVEALRSRFPRSSGVLKAFEIFEPSADAKNHLSW